MKTILSLITFIILASCSTTKNVSNNSISTTISTNKTAYEIGEPIELSMIVTNNGRRKFTFLPWGTPLEKRLTADCLLVKHNNQVVNYTGIMSRRIPPTKVDYITLQHNETAQGVINLLEGYNLAKAGTYTIQLKDNFRALPSSNIISIDIQESLTDCKGKAIADCMCTMQYDPVCGCDGKTYGNACTAKCAGVKVVSNGECE